MNPLHIPSTLILGLLSLFSAACHGTTPTSTLTEQLAIAYTYAEKSAQIRILKASLSLPHLMATDRSAHLQSIALDELLGLEDSDREAMMALLTNTRMKAGDQPKPENSEISERIDSMCLFIALTLLSDDSLASVPKLAPSSKPLVEHIVSERKQLHIDYEGPRSLSEALLIMEFCEPTDHQRAVKFFQKNGKHYAEELVALIVAHAAVNPFYSVIGEVEAMAAIHCGDPAIKALEAAQKRWFAIGQRTTRQLNGYLGVPADLSPLRPVWQIESAIARTLAEAKRFAERQS